MSNDSAGRDEFEKWCRSENICIDRDPADHGAYTFNMVQHRWQAWQAAISRQSAQGAEAVAADDKALKTLILHLLRDTDQGLNRLGIKSTDYHQPHEIRQLGIYMDSNAYMDAFSKLKRIDFAPPDTVPRAELEQYRKDAARCREAISAALRIKELWLPEVCDVENQTECQALHAMHNLFDRAMQEQKK